MSLNTGRHERDHGEHCASKHQNQPKISRKTAENSRKQPKTVKTVDDSRKLMGKCNAPAASAERAGIPPLACFFYYKINIFQ